MADPVLPSLRQGRGVSRRLLAVGRPDYHREGIDADPLQARDHHVGLCRVQCLAVRALLDHCPWPALLHGGGSPQPLWRMDPREDREAPHLLRPVGGDSARARLRHRLLAALRAVVSTFAGTLLFTTLGAMM